MIVKTVNFVKSSGKWQECPEPTIPEYAFIGRSNVGKSSLINAIMNHKDLAKTSQTPGKTQLINHFLVNENIYGETFDAINTFLKKMHVDVDYVDAYFLKRGINEWASLANREQLIIRAMDYIDNNYTYQGSKLVSTQSLEFPRLINGETVYPIALKNAVCEIKLFEFLNHLKFLGFSENFSMSLITS